LLADETIRLEREKKNTHFFGHWFEGMLPFSKMYALSRLSLEDQDGLCCCGKSLHVIQMNLENNNNNKKICVRL